VWKLRLLLLGLVVSALMLTGGFGHAASWLPMNQPTLDVDRSSDLVVKIKKKKHHHDDSGDNKTNQKGGRPIEASKPAPAEPETIQTETIQPGTDIEIQLNNRSN
jgi:hypothetical protein